MALNFEKLRENLRDFNFKDLFEELGWFKPSQKKAVSFECKGNSFTRRQIAELSGVAVFEVAGESGQIPDSKMRASVHREIAQQHHENFLVFLDKNRSQSLWYWVKREAGKLYPREHTYFSGQPGDLFLSKLGQMFVDISELDESGNIPIAQVAQRIQKALDVEPVTKKFYREYQEQRIEFIDLIEGVDDEKQRKWYASVLMNRLMFIYFLQEKRFLDDGNLNYLASKLDQSRARGADCFFKNFLKLLFFEGFAKPEEERSPEARATLGKIKYLNGGLFLPHVVEQRYPKLDVPDKAFDNLFQLFGRYSWNLNDTPGGDDDEINPDVLGYIFEKYINQKAFGAYYTRPEITEYLCERTIHRLILDAVEKIEPGKFTEIGDLLMNLDARLCKWLWKEVLPKLSLLDPACGSGAFLVAAMKVLVDIYSAIIGRIPFTKNAALKMDLNSVLRDHKSIHYYIKKSIITDNLYGVDIMEEATEIARLRLFLALVSSADSVDQLEPLPNIDFNILPGNSLIGLLHVDPAKFDSKTGAPTLPGRQAKMKLVSESGKHDLPGMTYETGTGPTDKERQVEYLRSIRSKKFAQIIEEKNRLIDNYRHAATYGQNLTSLRDNINAHKEAANATLNKLLLDEFQLHGIKYEQATWDTAKNKEGKPKKRSLTLDDIRDLQPFHWGFEFDKILARGGFDAIITNPPWEKFKPNAKEFFQAFSKLITKKTMLIHDFTSQQAALLQEPEIRAAWLAYLCQYPHQSAYFRAAEHYKNQASVVEGKKAGSDTNLYKLFVEQCQNLLREHGHCGIIVPSGIYTDLGAMQLRRMLFSSTELDSVIGLSNERFIFENVHHGFKFCLLTFRKSGKTTSIRVAFRINPREAIAPAGLESFLHDASSLVRLDIDVIQKLAPDSLSIMEFRSALDISISEKLLAHPRFGEDIIGSWNARFTTEFHMTNDSHLYLSRPSPNRLPLYEGKMIHQFCSDMGRPKYWVDEKRGRSALLGGGEDSNQVLDYEYYRLAFRDVTASTNERTMIATVLPRRVFCPHTISLENVRDSSLSAPTRIYLCVLLNSFVIDYTLRFRVTSHVSFYFVNAIPIPRPRAGSAISAEIVNKGSRLICTSPEFDDLAQEVGLGSHKSGATDPAERARLRAELDGIVAHLYGLTEDEFAHILTTFPLVEQGVKNAALQAYRDFAPKTADEEAAALIRAGENGRVEFKSTARWDLREGKANKEMERIVVREAAAFANSGGGTLLIGVADDKTVLGLSNDLQTFNEKKRDLDQYELWLTDLLLNGLGKENAGLFKVSFPVVDGRPICRVDIQPGTGPVYVTIDSDEQFHIRTGNSIKRLNSRETVEYVKTHWRN